MPKRLDQEEVRRRRNERKRKWMATKTPEQRRRYQSGLNPNWSKEYRSRLEVRFGLRIGKAFRLALNRVGETPRLTNHRVFDMLGYHAEDLRRHLEQWLGSPCMDCGIVIITLDNSHIDHVEPKSRARTVADAIRLNQLSNLRLICIACNLRKHDKHVDVTIQPPQDLIDLKELRKDRQKEKRREYRRRYRLEHPEEWATQRKAQRDRQKTTEAYRARQKRSRLRHRDHILARNRARYREQNPVVKTRGAKPYTAEQRAVARERKKQKGREEYRKTHPKKPKAPKPPPKKLGRRPNTPEQKEASRLRTVLRKRLARGGGLIPKASGRPRKSVPIFQPKLFD